MTMTESGNQRGVLVPGFPFLKEPQLRGGASCLLSLVTQGQDIGDTVKATLLVLFQRTLNAHLCLGK